MPAQPSEELRPGSGGADDAEHGQREAPEGQGLPQTVGFPAGEMHSVSLLMEDHLSPVFHIVRHSENK